MTAIAYAHSIVKKISVLIFECLCNYNILILVSITSIKFICFLVSMSTLRDELMISSGRGLLQRVCWSEAVIKSNSTIELASLPFSADLQHSRCEKSFQFCSTNNSFGMIFVATQLNNAHVFVSCLDYSPQMGGFAVVLSDGRGAFLAANSMKFEPHVSTFAQILSIFNSNGLAIN